MYHACHDNVTLARTPFPFADWSGWFLSTFFFAFIPPPPGKRDTKGSFEGLWIFCAVVLNPACNTRAHVHALECHSTKKKKKTPLFLQTTEVVLFYFIFLLIWRFQGRDTAGGFLWATVQGNKKKKNPNCSSRGFESTIKHSLKFGEERRAIALAVRLMDEWRARATVKSRGIQILVSY